jgi:predicted Zn finger-like uncharacterized protein
MPEVFLNCPKCQRQLRVTDELIGRPVKCPACGLTFTIPAGGTEPLLAPVPVLEEAPRQPPEREVAYTPHGPYDTGEARPSGRPLDFDQGDPGRARVLIMAPAIILLILNGIAFVAELFFIYLLSKNPDQLMKQIEQQLKAMNIQGGPMPSASFLMGMHAVFAVLSLVIVFTAIQMLRLRMYPLAVAGCFLPMINCLVYCCIPSFPFCIWAFIVLLRPEVRSAFR